VAQKTSTSSAVLRGEKKIVSNQNGVSRERGKRIERMEKGKKENRNTTKLLNSKNNPVNQENPFPWTLDATSKLTY